MKIGIVDADLIARKRHRFPNLACMKLSAYEKAAGNNVDLVMDYSNVQEYDRVYISKVFTDTPVPQDILSLPCVTIGGTGFFCDKAPPLPYEIEHIMPDYHLYDNFVNQLVSQGAKHCEIKYYTDYSIGFATRGCIRGCSFCVNKHYQRCSLHSPVEEFVDPSRKYICLLDDNILACKDWRSVFDQLNATGKRFQFKQGMDERLLTDEKCKVIFSSNWIGDYIFAFDNIRDRGIIESKLQLMRKYSHVIPTFYVFCAFNHHSPDNYSESFWLNDLRDVFERIRILFRYQARPYIMRYKDYELAPNPYRGIYITLARWSNQPSMIKKKSFREYSMMANGLYGAAHRYLMDFEKLHPDFASEYFDMKWNDFLSKK